MFWFEKNWIEFLCFFTTNNKKKWNNDLCMKKVCNYCLKFENSNWKIIHVPKFLVNICKTLVVDRNFPITDVVIKPQFYFNWPIMFITFPQKKMLKSVLIIYILLFPTGAWRDTGWTHNGTGGNVPTTFARFYWWSCELHNKQR